MQNEAEHAHPPTGGKPRNTTQVISLMVGFALFVLGLCGMLFSSFAGLHMSIIHSLVISAAGPILFYNGMNDHSWNSFICCLGFGLFFGVYSMLGFVLGKPGMPTVGHERWDPYLLVIIPNFQEFGRNDHVLNGVISLILMGGALDWARRHNEKMFGDRFKPHIPHRQRHA